MKFKDLLETPWPPNTVLTCVEEPWEESYLAPGMKCVFLGAIEDMNCVLVSVYVDPFMEHNVPLEPSDWYDNKGQPCLTASEAGRYPKDGKETFYLDFDDDTTKFFRPDVSKWWETYQKEKQSGDTNLPYVAWLEEKLERSST